LRIKELGTYLTLNEHDDDENLRLLSKSISNFNKFIIYKYTANNPSDVHEVVKF